MIKVNLLPPEYRKSDGPPIARVAALVVGAVVSASAFGFWCWMHFSVLAEAEAQRAEKEEQLAQVRAQAERSDALLREFQEYQRRRDTIEKIGSSRVLWSRKLDEMADLIHNKGDTKAFMVWLNAIRTTGARGPESPVGISISGVSGGAEYQKLSDFNRTIKETKEFFEDFVKVDPPEGTLRRFDDGRFPISGWEFSFTLDHKHPNWREKQ